MNLDQWAKVQTVAILKKLCISICVLLIPGFLVYLYASHSNYIQSMIVNNSPLILNSIQTGDWIQLERAVAGYKDDPAIYGYELVDRDGSILKAFSQRKSPILVFHKEIILAGGNSIIWGKLKIMWTLPWILIAYFVFGVVTVVVLVSVLVFNSWSKFTGHLVQAIQQLQDFRLQNGMPEFISKIDGLKKVFQELQLFQQSQIENERFKLLREREKEIVNISQKVVHDIRSPMSAIKIVLSTIDLDSTRKDLIDSAFTRMNEICNELLAERKELLKPTDTVGQALTQIANEMRIRNPDKKVNLNFSTDDLSQILPDNEFKSVMSNLMNNALDAIHSNSGLVQLFSEKSDGKLKIRIADNGVGIPPEILKQLGEKPLTYGKGENGNGIGFYNAKAWAKRFGGDLSISSQLGFGTEVILEIPGST